MDGEENMADRLVIVESPAKAKTLARMLGDNYIIKASLGHVRDLPKSHMGVDVENNFTPRYVIPREKKAVIKKLREAVDDASSIYLATDPDREGEAISWHLTQSISMGKKPVHRVIFFEITREAVKEAFQHPREIDMPLVYAQQTRRVLDRLVGYSISPLLWKNVRRGLSAGRVQSVALRMVVEREREIDSFVPTEYWSIEAELAKILAAEIGGIPASFRARLIGFLGSKRKLKLGNEEETRKLVDQLGMADYAVFGINKKTVSRQPAPPFTTSTLQQEAWRKLHFTAKHTMVIAQQLYEGLNIGTEGIVGLITYIRTDSTTVSTSAIEETRTYIGKHYGDRFLPPNPRRFTKKAKGAQEAHEAIRPTRIAREPETLKPRLTPDQTKLYELIWRRMVASQMTAASFNITTADIEAKVAGEAYLLRVSSSVRDFPGFLILYSEGKDEAEDETGAAALPELNKDERLTLLKLYPEKHFTQPLPRYTEATLIKALEENGIGRPSTYAPTLSTIQERDYVRKERGQFHPQELGFVVNDLLVEHFSDFIDVSFTAQMEEKLDEIARGEREWVPILREFYTPFEKSLERASKQMGKVKIADELTGEICPLCKSPMVIKLGRYGKFMACSGYPQCKYSKPLLIKTGVSCPECGGELVERRRKKGGRIFYGCANYPRCQFAISRKPLPHPCPKCGALLVLNGKKVKCLKCDYTDTLAKLKQQLVVKV
jgi:DNA topoisomerase-1